MSDPTTLISLLREEANLDVKSATPLYLRVQRGLEQAIEAGAIAVHDALPAERELANALGVSRVTVRNAVRALVEKGMLVQRHGAGTFVASRVEQPLKQLTGFTQDMTERGMTSTVQWLDRSIGLPAPEECEALGIDSTMAVSRLYRLRLADNKPMCIEHAVLPIHHLDDPMAVETSLYDHLERQKRRPVRAIQKLSARLLDISHAHLLGVPTGSPCLYIERCSFLPNDEPVEFVRSYYRGDSYEFVAELQL
ncbi:MAG: GntR family transcriptional regulator [Cohaesibacter sp.]|nr:GntR family transcriptional regulator [Cohaesibacter sp.]MCV6600060.1 GntR family transcriptional regulator [Cohaesibacter sp.]